MKWFRRWRNPRPKAPTYEEVFVNGQRVMIPTHSSKAPRYADGLPVGFRPGDTVTGVGLSAMFKWMEENVGPTAQEDTNDDKPHYS